MAGLEAPLDLGAQGSVAVAAVGSVLEKVVFVGTARELLAAEEVVVDAVALALARSPGRRRGRELELGQALAQDANQRALADPRGAGDDEDLGHGREPKRGVGGIGIPA